MSGVQGHRGTATQALRAFFAGRMTRSYVLVQWALRLLLTVHPAAQAGTGEPWGWVRQMGGLAVKPTRELSAPPLRTFVRRRRRLSWLQALLLVASVTLSVVVTAALLVTRTDPDRYPDLGTGLWWAVTTITTVGYGDVVPMSIAGRLVGSVLMFVGIGSIAFLTAVAASAIVVGEVAEEEQEIEREEREIERIQEAIFRRLGEIDARLERLEAHQTPQSTHPTSLSRTVSRQG